MQGFWILGKISDHQAFPLDAEDIDRVVEQLTQCARIAEKLDREKMARVICWITCCTSVAEKLSYPTPDALWRAILPMVRPAWLERADALIKYLTE
jgi:hypothetical protein